MALSSADYYWVDVFKAVQKQTDCEIEALNALGANARRVFASSLVESQRISGDLACHFELRKQNSINFILHHERWPDLLGPEASIGHADLMADPILRLFAENALKYLDSGRAENIGQLALYKKSSDLCEVDPGLDEELACLLKYVRDAFKRRDEVQPIEEKSVLDKTSPEEFTLEDVPRQELQKRLNRGEIAPRDEWIPSEDKNNKKTITNMELRARLSFGDRLMTEAKAAMDKGDYELSSTLYTQGVHLLNQYKCDATADACDLADWLGRFRRNNAIANLKLGRYRQAIASCTETLEDDEHDGKARFLRAKARQAVGDLEGAEEDLKSLMSDGFASDAQRKAGQEGLRQLRIEAKRDRHKVASLFQGVTSETCFSSDRPTEHDSDDTTATPTERRFQSSTRRKEEPLPMAPGKYIKLLESMLRAYTLPATADRLEAIRHKVDYNERKIIIKLQTVLPEILMPILREYNILPDSEDYTLKKKELDRIIGVFQTSMQVSKADRSMARSLLKSIREALVGGEETSG